MSAGRTLFFRAGNWSTSADGDWTPMRVLLHESVWFVDNSTTSPTTTNDFQGDSFFVTSCLTVKSLQLHRHYTYTILSTTALQ